MSMVIRDRENQIIEDLFSKYYAPLKAYACSLVHQINEAEDIVQDAFYEIWVHRSSIRFEDKNIKSYLYKVVYNRSINVIKKNARGRKKEVDIDDSIFSYLLKEETICVEELYLYNELREEIKKYISEFPFQRRRVFELSRTKEMKNKEIATLLGISIKAVEKHITLSISTLKKHLQENGFFIRFIMFMFYLNNK